MRKIKVHIESKIKGSTLSLQFVPRSKSVYNGFNRYFMKKFALLIIIFLSFILNFLLQANCEEVFKITSANFDTASSVIVINAKDTASEENMLKYIKPVKLENPARAYFDIDSAILTLPKQDWTLNTGGIKQVKISQFSTNPNIVRVVLYFSDDYDLNMLKFFRIKNNIIIKTKNNTFANDYFQLTYRDEHASSSDFYEALTVTSPVIEQTQPDLVTQIQEAFNATNTDDTEPSVVTNEKKNLKLNTKFYLNNVSVKQNGILINGLGTATIEKPMILQNPNRIVYDLPNALTSQAIRNKEFKISETETAKIGQFAMNKARIVITTNDVNDYIPIFSSDNQSLLLVNSKKVQQSALFTKTADVIAYNKEQNDDRTSSMVLSFNHPIIHGIERNNNSLNIYLYNVSKYSEELFNSTYAHSSFFDAKMTLMPKIGMVLTIPLQNDTLVNTFLGADCKNLKIQITGVSKTVSQPAAAVPKKTAAVKKIVIDAGHGGSDCGALRGTVNEKDITLDVAKLLKTLLVKQGYNVLMTRENDSYLSLQERVDISEEFNPDIFISIHVNSSVRPEITGVETHYYHQESLTLAQTVHAAIASNIKSKNRGLFKSKFYVINHTTSPAILCEIGFISNDEERKQLNSDKRKQETAKAILEGVNNYFKQQYR